MRNYIFLITILKHITGVWSLIASLYTVPLSALNVLSRLTKLAYDEQRSRHGRFDSKIFESANPFRIESNRTVDSNSNQISKLRRSLVQIRCWWNLAQMFRSFKVISFQRSFLSKTKTGQLWYDGMTESGCHNVTTNYVINIQKTTLYVRITHSVSMLPWVYSVPSFFFTFCIARPDTNAFFKQHETFGRVRAVPQPTGWGTCWAGTARMRRKRVTLHRHRPRDTDRPNATQLYTPGSRLGNG